MEPIRALIADDDAGMRLLMRKLLEKSGGFALCGDASDGEELLRLSAQEHPQVVLLDVEMPKVTGVECARILQDTDPQTILIFATAHDKYMADAFEVYAFDYLLKPFRAERALATLERVKAVLQTREDAAQSAKPIEPRPQAGRMLLKHRDGVSVVNMEDILLIQREERATVIYTVNDGRYVTGDSLGDIEARLDPSMFMRCHKSYIINLSHVDSISPYGRWTYVVKLRGTRRDALITHEKYEELEKLFG